MAWEIQETSVLFQNHLLRILFDDKQMQLLATNILASGKSDATVDMNSWVVVLVNHSVEQPDSVRTSGNVNNAE